MTATILPLQPTPPLAVKMRQLAARGHPMARELESVAEAYTYFASIRFAPRWVPLWARARSLYDRALVAWGMDR